MERRLVFSRENHSAEPANPEARDAALQCRSAEKNCGHAARSDREGLGAHLLPPLFSIKGCRGLEKTTVDLEKCRLEQHGLAYTETFPTNSPPFIVRAAHVPRFSQ